MSINIEELRRLHAATTQGQWTGTEGEEFPKKDEFTTADYRWMDEAHNQMPALLDEIERLTQLADWHAAETHRMRMENKRFRAELEDARHKLILKP